MTFEVLDEHEQGERVQKWLRDNAMSILIGIGVGLLLIFGWQQWKVHQARHKLEAATQYHVFVDKLDKKDYAAATTLKEKLRSDYNDTAYAILAAMRQAEADLKRNEKESARSAMEWAYQNSKNLALKTLAGTRLAQLQLAENKADAALTLLNSLPQESYAELIAELRGDALVALGRKDEAKTAYQEALTVLEPGASSRTQLEMKLNDLGVDKQSIEKQS